MSSQVSKEQLRFGVFLPPFHNLNENPTLALERDFQLMEHLDSLGYEEAWIGEHHSGGLEIIGSPELFIAEAAVRTRHIRFGTGVVSMPFHHPFMIAQRITQLDHQLRGRLMFGVGAGSLSTDVHMLGLKQTEIRATTDQALDLVIRLLKGEVISHEDPRYTLRDGRLQLACFTRPHPEVVIASTGTPSGPRAAGKYGGGILSLGVSRHKGKDFLADSWRHWTLSADEHGTTPDRSRWRIAGPVHIAETREQARIDVRYGIRDWMKYLRLSPAFSTLGPNAAEGTEEELVDRFLDTGTAVIGTPDDLIEHIELLWERSGGFGCWLDLTPNWATFAARKRSYELIAEYVVPHFKASNSRRAASFEWSDSMRHEFFQSRMEGVTKEIEKWQALEVKTPKA